MLNESKTKKICREGLIKMEYNEVQEGDEVYWEDPAGITSGIYSVVIKYEDMGPTTVLLLWDGYTEVEVFLSELS